MGTTRLFARATVTSFATCALCPREALQVWCRGGGRHNGTKLAAACMQCGPSHRKPVLSGTIWLAETKNDTNYRGRCFSIRNQLRGREDGPMIPALWYAAFAGQVATPHTLCNPYENPSLFLCARMRTASTTGWGGQQPGTRPGFSGDRLQRDRKTSAQPAGLAAGRRRLSGL
jgi:hypothetical protein